MADKFNSSNVRFSQSITALKKLALIFVGEGKLNNIKAIVEGYPKLVKEKVEQGLTLLGISVKENQYEICKYLLERGSDPNVCNYANQSLISMAISNNNYQICKLLLENHADINFADKNGWTPLIFAANIGNENIINLLLSYAPNLYATDKYGKCAHERAKTPKIAQIIKSSNISTSLSLNPLKEENMIEIFTNTKVEEIKEESKKEILQDIENPTNFPGYKQFNESEMILSCFIEKAKKTIEKSTLNNIVMLFDSCLKKKKELIEKFLDNSIENNKENIGNKLIDFLNKTCTDIITKYNIKGSNQIKFTRNDLKEIFDYNMRKESTNINKIINQMKHNFIKNEFITSPRKTNREKEVKMLNSFDVNKPDNKFMLNFLNSKISELTDSVGIFIRNKIEEAVDITIEFFKEYIEMRIKNALFSLEKDLEKKINAITKDQFSKELNINLSNQNAQKILRSTSSYISKDCKLNSEIKPLMRSPISSENLSLKAKLELANSIMNKSEKTSKIKNLTKQISSELIKSIHSDQCLINNSDFHNLNEENDNNRMKSMQ